MPELLLELFSEEIPARFQRRAAEDLKMAVTSALVDAGLGYEGARAFVTPRRLALTVTGLPARSPDTREEKKGPRVGAPQPAIDGFLKSAGLSSIEQARIESDPKKGEFYVARIERQGAAAPEILVTLLPRVIAAFEWAKSMRWGSGTLNWVRPLRAVTATFGTGNDEPVVIPFAAGTLHSGQTTYGHRFLAPAAIRVRRFDDYVQALERAKVILDLDRRMEIIKADAEHLAFAQGLTVIEDAGLLEEVAGLVEWPVVMMGAFEESFLELPEEVIIATIRANQKCFCLRDAYGKLADKFILTANTIAQDGGTMIVGGNERVIRARLSDAKFFYEHDLATPLEDGLPKLKDMVFHAKLGSQFERVERLVALAGEIAPLVGADAAQAKRAARLAKADLVTGMVGEFPELQGLMGRYYALAQGEPPAVANAIADHYKPLGPTDKVPAGPVAIAVALADKLDLLTGFWAVDEKPTGSRDPFALRRAALGVIRIVVENGLSFRLAKLVEIAFALLWDHGFRPEHGYRSLATTYDVQTETGPEQSWAEDPIRRLLNADGFVDQHGSDAGMYQIGNPDLGGDPDSQEVGAARYKQYQKLYSRLEVLDHHSVHYHFEDITGEHTAAPIVRILAQARPISWLAASIDNLVANLLPFFHDRLKVTLRDAGVRYDLADAVISQDSDDILQITQRVDALSSLLSSEDGKNLLAGYRRAVNILSIEEKKDGRSYSAPVDQQLLTLDAEVALANAIKSADVAVAAKIAADDYKGAMAALATLRAPVDTFFEAVLVNDPDPAIRANRLNLLALLRDTMHLVADFSKVAG